MNPHGEIPEFRARYRYLVAAVCLTFMVLMGRLCQMQVVKGAEYVELSENNFVQELRIPTVRGLVHDRKQRLLVSNRPSYDVYLTPRFATEEVLERVIEELLLGAEAAGRLRQKFRAATGPQRFQPLLVHRDINRDQLALIETHMQVLHGVSIQSRAHRNYLHENLGAHVLGYMNEVSAADLARDRAETYRPGDMIGRSGIERMYEDHLRGVPGRERIVVDARGRRKQGPEAEQLLRGARRVEPRPGHNVVLTIDIELQRLAERALRRYPSGAAVVLEVETGRVLASASRPAFDPNMLTGRLSQADARRLLDDPNRPMLDKVYREHYFPGSTYKVIPAIAALEDQIIDPEQEIKCSGWHHFGRRNFRCSHSHGKVGMHAAIVGSCNVYFYTLAEMVGMDRIARYAHMFGLGAPTGIGLNGEVSGFIPTKAWYARRNQPFRIGFTLNAALGQGNTKTTLVQIASLYATIANGGKLYLPQIVERVETTDGSEVLRFRPRLRRQVPIQPQTLAFIRRALEGVVSEEEGTASTARLANISVAGKTGTAQVGRRAGRGQDGWLGDHAWFAAYAPADAPEIALAVIIEHGGKAARVAAPVAMEIIDGYFKYVRAQQVRPRAAAGGAR